MAEAEVTTLKQRLANCEEALRHKVATLTEAEKGQVELRNALAAKEAELVAVQREAAEERRRSTDTNYLRGKLGNAEADIRSLQRRNGILRSDVTEFCCLEKQMKATITDMRADMEQLREKWERVQPRLVAEVERTNEENTRLTQAMSTHQAELEKARREREEAECRCKSELAIARLEVLVANEDVWTMRATRDAVMKDNDRLRKEIEQKAFAAQVNLKRILERFREQTRVAIEKATTSTLQSWAEQAAELQVLRADKANRDRRGPGFWKLDKANCEAVQKNLTTDFLRLAESHRVEIARLLDFQETLVERMRTEMETVAEPIKPAEPAAVASEFEDHQEDDPAEEQEPSLLHVLNED
jgi:uncharacterized protein YukE